MGVDCKIDLFCTAYTGCLSLKGRKGMLAQERSINRSNLSTHYRRSRHSSIRTRKSRKPSIPLFVPGSIAGLTKCVPAIGHVQMTSSTACLSTLLATVEVGGLRITAIARHSYPPPFGIPHVAGQVGRGKPGIWGLRADQTTVGDPPDVPES